MVKSLHNNVKQRPFKVTVRLFVHIQCTTRAILWSGESQLVEGSMQLLLDRPGSFCYPPLPLFGWGSLALPLLKLQPQHPALLLLLRFLLHVYCDRNRILTKYYFLTYHFLTPLKLQGHLTNSNQYSVSGSDIYHCAPC